MKTTVIAVANQKGGCGKTTVSTTIAGGLMARGYDTALIDADPQGSSSDWVSLAEQGGKPAPMVMGMALHTLDQHVEKLRGRYEFIVIDCPSGANSMSGQINAAAIKAADMVVMPLLCSQYDIWAASVVVDMIKERQKIADGRPKAVILLNEVRPGVKLANETRELIDELGLPHLDTELPLAEGIKQAQRDGDSVFGLPPGSKLRSVGEELMNEIQEVLDATE